LTRNSSADSPEPIFNNAVKAGAEAEPYSSAEANKGSNCENQTSSHLSIWIKCGTY